MNEMQKKGEGEGKDVSTYQLAASVFQDIKQRNMDRTNSQYCSPFQ